MDRRYFLGTIGVGTIGVGAGLVGRLGPGAPGLLEGHAAKDVPLAARPQSLTLTAAPEAVDTAVGRVEAWSLNGSLPAPTLRFRQGDMADITLRNELSEPTILHWHGLDVPESADGHPRYAIEPGATYDYRFRVKDRPGLYWYHPHTHQRTAAQTYKGMAGLFVIEGDEEDALPLPSEASTIPLVLQDRRVGEAGPFDYRPPGMGPDVMYGYLGDTPYANGQTGAAIDVSRGVHRLRILNASNARILDLGLSTGAAMTLIGTDGGLLPSAVSVTRMLMGTGERADLLVDFSDYAPGTRIVLRTHEFTIPGMMGMGGGGGGMGRGRMGGMGGMGGMGMGGPAQGMEMDMVEFVVTETPGEDARPLPSRLSTPAGPTPDADSRRRTFRFESGMMQHTINGRAFAMDRADVEIRRGETQVWSIENLTGLPHPVHVHVGQFRVLSRTGGRASVMPWETGLKDTVLVLPGETVQIAVRFDEYPGLFLMHCHNLEHEDAGMMMNFRVVE